MDINKICTTIGFIFILTAVSIAFFILCRFLDRNNTSEKMTPLSYIFLFLSILLAMCSLPTSIFVYALCHIVSKQAVDCALKEEREKNKKYSETDRRISCRKGYEMGYSDHRSGKAFGFSLPDYAFYSGSSFFNPDFDCNSDDFFDE